jgi:hypothetical protein
MTTATSSFVWAGSSATATRTWIDGVKNVILAAGLTVTTDTGQLDTTTIVATPAANSTMGYHVFKFPDALQATTPIIIKLTYSQSASSTPYVSVDVGSSTNGAGVVAVPLINVAVNSQTNHNTTTAIPSYACYVDGTFTMVLGYNYATGSNNNSISALVIDRARNTAGVAESSGFLVETPSAGQATNSQSRSFYGAASPAVSAAFVPSLIPSRNAVGSAMGLDVNVFRHYMMIPGVRPSLGSLTYFAGEFAALTPITVPVLGSDHTYLPMGTAMTHWSAAVTPSNTHCAAIRWE